MIAFLMLFALAVLWVWLMFKHIFWKFWPMTFTIGGHLPIATGMMLFLPLLVIGTTAFRLIFNVAWEVARMLATWWLATIVYTVVRATFRERRLCAMSEKELDEYIRRRKWM